MWMSQAAAVRVVFMIAHADDQFFIGVAIEIGTRYGMTPEQVFVEHLPCPFGAIGVFSFDARL